MTVPSKEQFAEWISSTQAPIAVPFELPNYWETLDRTTALEYTVVAEDAQLACWLRLLDSAVAQWLRGQRSYRRAREIVFGKSRLMAIAGSHKPVDRTDSVLMGKLDGIVNRLFTRHESTKGKVPDRVPMDSAITRLWLEARTTPFFQSTWTVRCVAAVGEYLYKDSCEQILTTRKSAEKIAKDAERAIQAYLDLADAIKELDVDMKFSSLGILRRYASLQTPDVDSLPLRRLDARSRERLFVYRMWRANTRATSKPRTEAIAELMGIEGFQHQYDSRTVERLCAEFTGKTRKKSSA